MKSRNLFYNYETHSVEQVKSQSSNSNKQNTIGMKKNVEAINRFKRWTPDEDDQLINFDHERYTDVWLAKKLNRTKRAIDGRRYTLRNMGINIISHTRTTAKR